MRRPMVAGNWKMNGSQASIDGLMAGIRSGLKDGAEVDVAVFPPFPYLSHAVRLANGTGIAVGAQDLSVNTAGAFTGEVSGAMIADCGATMTLVGHSERRTLHGETSELVADKAAAALAAGLTPVVCVGETLEQRNNGQTDAVVTEQLDAVITRLGWENTPGIIIAYEPVWAIGTGQTATPDQAQAVHATIRSKLAQGSDTMAGQLRILYGGSVKGSNAQELFSMADIDGGLIGGASLSAEDFLPICHAG
ncbi:MAG: triose-phosphate isomerase [Pseudomonadota bacterium]